MITKLFKCFTKSKRLHQSEQLFKTMFEQSAPLCILDMNGKFIRVNQALANLLEYTQEELEQLTTHQITKKEYLDITNETFKQLQNGQIEYAQFEKQYITKNENIIDCLITTSRVSDYDFLVTHFIDITNRKRNEETIYQLAYYDSLTGLPNRASFKHYANQACKKAQDTDTCCAFFLMDIDGFKYFNDSRGHAFGDAVLEQCGIMLNNTAEKLNQQNIPCSVARLGGDEFIVICNDIKDAGQAESIATIIEQNFSQPITLHHQTIHLTLSMGISLFPYDDNTCTALLKAADLALYKAKDKGKGQYCFYDISQVTRIEQYYEYERALQYFIQTDDFELYYQPYYYINEHKFSGAEALFRGNTNRYSDVDIGRLMEVADQTGLISTLGDQIMRKACRYCAHIRQHYDCSFIISVNVSTIQLQQPTFIDQLAEILIEYGLPYSALDIEITETTLMTDFSGVVEKLQMLRNKGVYISIDDFGKGYSSMTYIQQLPITRIKIDKEFVDNIANDLKSKEIVRGLLRMTNMMDLLSCVEGVENKEQYDILSSLHVNHIQGYYMCKPLSETDLERLLESE